MTEGGEEKPKLTQAEWDHLLLTAFFEHPDMYMNRFNGDVTGLRRTPKFPYQWNMTVCRFVCAKLPKVAELLWARGKEHVPKIVVALALSKLDTASDVNAKDSRESSARQRLVIENQKEKMERDMRKAYNQAQNNTAWNLVK